MSGNRFGLLSGSLRLLLAGSCFAGVPARAVSSSLGAPVEEEENVLKARFLAKVCAFVDWPRGSSVNDAAQPFVIGILPNPSTSGANRWEDPFVRAMRELFLTTPLKNKKVVFKNLTSINEIRECQAIYVMPVSRSGITGVLKVTRPLHTLVFGQTEGFAELGVHLNFIVVDKRLRFEINESSFQDAELKIDSLILRSAIVVKRREAKP